MLVVTMIVSHAFHSQIVCSPPASTRSLQPAAERPTALFSRTARAPHAFLRIVSPPVVSLITQLLADSAGPQVISHPRISTLRVWESFARGPAAITICARAKAKLPAASRHPH